MSYLEKLNPEQRSAAEHFEGPLLVLAGAGSGKTRVLTSRIAHLIEEYGVDPGSILSLTFTNKAAAEMRDRVRALLGRDPAGMWIGTFHAIGARMLRRDASRLGWTPGFLIYDADDSERLVKRILKDELQLDPKPGTIRSIRSMISSAKNELVGPAEFQDRAFDPIAKAAAQVYERYDQALRDANAFDFDDLLVRPVELLRKFPDLRERYRSRFKFVLVDEYQDTNHAQYEFLRLIAGPSEPGSESVTQGGNLFVVGDDDQSIYGWRGANIRNILDFEKDFPDSGIVRLEENYRSTQRILEAANQVISKNLRRKGKTLRTANGPGESITLVEAADEADEAGWIAGEIRKRLSADSDSSPRDFAVLYRTNAQSRALEEAFRREGIPYRIVGGQRFYERREVKDILGYLRLIANPADNESFLRVANFPKRGIGETSLIRLAEYGRETRLTLLAAAERADEISTLRGAASTSLTRFAAMIRRFAFSADAGMPVDELLRELVETTAFREALLEEGLEGQDRIANVEELISSASDLQARAEAGDPEMVRALEEAESETGVQPLDLFLAHVALVTDIDQKDPDAAVSTLMTMHNAKGLEFPTVFLAGLEDGLFPLARTRDTPEELEEERRLFYVGITRAERKLYLTSARRRRRGGEWLDSVPSGFLESISRDLLDVRRTRQTGGSSTARFASPVSGETARFSSATRRSRLGLDDGGGDSGIAQTSGRVVDYSDSQDSVRLVKGARVRHPQFGAGTVLELSGFGNDVRAAIQFDSVGRKVVVVRYANLESDWE
ncbi:MAG: UvrD-helicase domain-containing protein [Gemmatimonadota bacterium]|jgi:DNA helicase-2/ATP-dependent DNA helicase PcrA|nr:UvrD-helicase domain-containing protein [Gemmatimonadota bacterium]